MFIYVSTVNVINVGKYTIYMDPMGIPYMDAMSYTSPEPPVAACGRVHGRYVAHVGLLAASAHQTSSRTGSGWQFVGRWGFV